MNPWGLEAWQREILLAGISRVQAKDTLERWKTAVPNERTVAEIVRLATGSKVTAEMAVAQFRANSKRPPT